MKLPRRNFLHLAAGAAALPAVSQFARARGLEVDRKFVFGWVLHRQVTGFLALEDKPVYFF
jgi:hypothetical protein